MVLMLWSRDCFGLAIVKEISSLRELNRPLPPELVEDMKRIAALAHNTLVQYDPLFCPNWVPVPDAESEVNLHIQLPSLQISGSNVTINNPKHNGVQHVIKGELSLSYNVKSICSPVNKVCNTLLSDHFISLYSCPMTTEET